MLTVHDDVAIAPCPSLYSVRCFEDLQPGDVALGSTFVVERDEMVEFARRRDPQPFHLDNAVANAMIGEGGVTAPGVLVLAIGTPLLHDTPDLAVKRT